MGYSDEHRWAYKAIEVYKEVTNPDEWLPCPVCGLIPLVWEFDNGRSTACECGKSEYIHHTVQAESINSFMRRNNGSMLGYNQNELRDNWNHWVKTGEYLFKRDYPNKW